MSTDYALTIGVDLSVGRHARAYWPYVLALLAGRMLIIAIPELSLFLPRSGGMIR